MKDIFLLLFLCAGLVSSGQDINPEEKMILGDTLIFLGFDFSTAQFQNPAKVAEALYIRDKHGPDWAKVDDMLVARQDMKYDFQKKVVIPMTSALDSSYKRLDEHWIKDKCDAMSDDDVRQHIKGEVSVRASGLGIVLLVDKMDIAKKSLTLCAVYVDLYYNKVIKIIRAEGFAGGSFGYTPYFDTALESSYKDVITNNDKYLKSLRKYFNVKK